MTNENTEPKVYCCTWCRRHLAESEIKEKKDGSRVCGKCKTGEFLMPLEPTKA